MFQILSFDLDLTIYKSLSVKESNFNVITVQIGIYNVPCLNKLKLLYINCISDIFISLPLLLINESKKILIVNIEKHIIKKRPLLNIFLLYNFIFFHSNSIN